MKVCYFCQSQLVSSSETSPLMYCNNHPDYSDLKIIYNHLSNNELSFIIVYNDTIQYVMDFETESFYCTLKNFNSYFFESEPYPISLPEIAKKINKISKLMAFL